MHVHCCMILQLEYGTQVKCFSESSKCRLTRQQISKKCKFLLSHSSCISNTARQTNVYSKETFFKLNSLPLPTPRDSICFGGRNLRQEFRKVSVGNSKMTCTASEISFWKCTQSRTYKEKPLSLRMNVPIERFFSSLLLSLSCLFCFCVVCYVIKKAKCIQKLYI